jgi:toxin YhaV
VVAGVPVANGWRLFGWRAFRLRFQQLVAEVERLRAEDPEGYGHHSSTKLLAAVHRLVVREIPRDPGAARFRQGNTLGPAHRHWYRAKYRRFRLFYRYHSDAGIIVYAWLNDEETLREEGARTDPYVVFRKMLERGHPPTTWGELLEASRPLQRLLDV